jgi:chemotaxis protein histidine kinase CheA
LQTFAQLVILNEYSIGFEEKAQEKLELLRSGINQAEGDAAGKDYSAVRVTLKAALVKNSKIVVPDGKGGTKELTDPEINNLVEKIVEMAIGVGKMPKPEKIDAFAMEILTQLRGKGKLDETRRSWFLRAERNARKSPVEILSDNILLLTLIGTVFGGVAIVGAAFENPMKNAMARAANRQGNAAAKATLLQAEAAARESNARAEHTRALTAAAKAQAAALLKVTEAEAASKIARLAANNATNAERRKKAKDNAAAAEKTLREAKAAMEAADKHLDELKLKKVGNKTRQNTKNRNENMPGLEKSAEELAIERELAAAEAEEKAASNAAATAANAAAAQAASNAAATAAAERIAAELRNKKAAAAAEPAKKKTPEEMRQQRAEAAARRLGKGGGTRRRRIYRSRTRRHR